MASITDFNTYKPIEVTSATDTPTISRALCFKITSGDDSTIGTGEIVLDWSNISSQADIGVYDENDNLLDYYFESFDATAETAVIWVYRDWVRDGSTQAKIAYGSGPSDQSVAASTVFDKESNLLAGYLLNETSGDALDVTSNNNDGTVTGATQGESGIVGEAYGFDGSDDEVNIKPSIGIRGEVLTMEGWFYPRELAADNRTIWPGYKVRLDWNTDNNYEIGFKLYDGSTFWKLGYTVSSINAWYHVVGVFDPNSGMTLFVDSVERDSNSTTNAPVSSTTDAGLEKHGSAKASMIIDNVRYYHEALSSDSIVASFAATKSTPDFFSQQAAVVVATDSPTNVTSSSATLNGTLNNLQGNSSLDVYFEWGTDTSYGNTTATQTISSVPTSFDADVFVLTAFETYHYRAVATDGTNYWYGGDISFYTVDLQDVDDTQSDFQEGTLTDVEADAGDYLRLADTDVLSFDGENNYVNCTTTPNLDQTSFTIEGWFLGRDVANEHVHIGKHNASSDDESLHFGIRSGSPAQATLAFFGDDVNGSTEIQNDTWYHIAGTFDYSTLEQKIYLDGSLENSRTANDGLRNTDDDPLEIMRAMGEVRGPGDVSDLRIWDHVRTQTEIQNNMHKRLNGDETGLVAYYKLDEGTGDTVYDSAGINDGTINGASWTTASLYFVDGNRISPQLDLSSLGTVSDTIIEWTETLNSQTITIETRVSLDGGTSWTAWATATNGGTIPDLSSGTDVSNGILECRQTFSTSDSTVTPELHSLTVALTEGTSGYTLTASAGSYSWSGAEAANLLDAIIKANSGGYQKAGSEAALHVAKILEAQSNFYGLSGSDSFLTAKKLIDAITGSYELSSIDVTLLASRTIDAVASSYNLSGSDSDLTRSFLVVADSAAYVVSGLSATLTHIVGITFNAEPGIYAISGQTAELLRSLFIQANEGVYATAGAVSALGKSYLLVTGSGSYLAFGESASLFYLGEVVLSADPGIYSLSGDETTLHYILAIVLGADPGSYALSGVNSQIHVERIIKTFSGTYEMSAPEVSALASYALQSVSGNYVVDGSENKVTRDILGDLTPGTYTVSGKDANLLPLFTKVLQALSGSYSLSGNEASLLLSETVLDSGVYRIDGKDLKMTIKAEGLAKGRVTVSFSAETAKVGADGQMADTDFDGSIPEIIIKPK